MAKTLGVALFFLKTDGEFIQSLIDDPRTSYICSGQIAFPTPSTYVAYLESKDHAWLYQLLKTEGAYGNTVCPVNRRQAIGFIKKGWNWHERPATATASTAESNTDEQLPPKKRKRATLTVQVPVVPTTEELIDVTEDELDS